MAVALMMSHLYRWFRYHNSEARPDGIFAPISGLAERRSKSGHCTSLTTFSTIDPNTNGCHPEMPWVEMTTVSICSRSTTSMMFPPAPPSHVSRFVQIAHLSRKTLFTSLTRCGCGHDANFTQYLSLFWQVKLLYPDHRTTGYVEALSRWMSTGNSIQMQTSSFPCPAII